MLAHLKRPTSQPETLLATKMVASLTLFSFFCSKFKGGVKELLSRMCLQVILYNTRGLHRKALELLSAHSGREDSPLQGTSRTVTYLQV